jgi:Tfp pilus assembly protein PilX
MRHPRDERGFALATALILLSIIMGLGLALLMFTDTQQKASGREQAGEASFNVAEAALNAQIGQVSRAWPTTLLQPETGCTAATSTTTNDCPSAESMNVPYPTSAASCPSASPQDAWGSPTSNQWTTYVRDDTGSGGTSLFDSSTEKGVAGYDLNGDNKVWVRAVAVVRCRLVSLASLVSRQEIAASFPHTLMSANYFKTGNNGNGHEVIVEGKELGSSEGTSQNGEILMRCNGFATTAECENYREGQIANAQVSPPPGAPTPTLSASQLAAYRQMAEGEHTYYPAGKCPTGLPSGKLVFVEGSCAVEGGKQEIGNSKEHPGFLIVAKGTFEMNGSAEFWGTVYAANKQESSGIIVKLGGGAVLHGELNVDGNGGIEVGENHQKNLEFDPRAAAELKVYAGATPTRNTFRVLTSSE